MMLATNQIRFKLLAVVVVIVLMAPMVLVPAEAAHAQEKCFYERVKYLDIEIKVIDGQPMFVYETEKGYEKIPFSMSDLGGYAYADGQKVSLRTQGNNILVPTEEGLVPVPIEEFDVVVVDGQVMLLAEENPWLAIAFYGLLGAAAGAATASAFKLGKKGTAALTGVGAALGGAYGAKYGAK